MIMVEVNWKTRFSALGRSKLQCWLYHSHEMSSKMATGLGIEEDRPGNSQ